MTVILVINLSLFEIQKFTALCPYNRFSISLSVVSFMLLSCPTYHFDSGAVFREERGGFHDRELEEI